MSKSLYNIETQYLEYIEAIQMLDGELTPEMEQMLSINEAELHKKSLAYSEIINSKTSRIELIDAEIKRLTAMKKSEKNIIERMKTALVTAVNIFGEFEHSLHKFGIRKSTSVEVDDVNNLPDKFKVVKVTEQADKKAIKEALQSGEEVAGCRIVNNQNLKIS